MATSAVRKELKDTAEETKNTVREVAKDAGSNVRSFLHDQSEKAAELRHHTEDKIKENPMKSVALAALGGVIVGALLRR